jgi:hypothetical protein
MCNTWLLRHCLVAAALLITACAPVRPASTPTPVPDRWQELQAWAPYPHTTPLPPEVTTPIDGFYVRFDPRTEERTPCRRCPPYPPEGGVWVLALEQGTFRVYHPRTGWRTLGSYTVSDDQITLFNDPQCHLAVGHFTWLRDEKGLHFALADDECELGTRAKNFTAQTWESCLPPNPEAAVTGHWSAPQGCNLAAHTGSPTPKAPTLSQ